MFFEQLKKEQQVVEAHIRQIEEKLCDMREGKLICSKNESSYKWYVSDGKNYTYLPKDNIEVAEELAKKKYYMAWLKELTYKQKALDKCVNTYLSNPDTLEVFMEKHPGICQLLKAPQKNLSDELAEWANAEYKRNTGHPEHLKFDTPWGEVFRSKSESMIATRLRERGIPYRYECALELGGETLYPDFTIRHPRTGRIYYYEHFGKMDDVSYTNRNLPKIPFYTKHGIIPGIHLIMSFETQDEPLTLYTIENTLTQYFG